MNYYYILRGLPSLIHKKAAEILINFQLLNNSLNLFCYNHYILNLCTIPVKVSAISACFRAISDTCSTA